MPKSLARQLSERSNAIVDVLFGRADLEAQAGAKIITFGEINIPVLMQFEAELMHRASQFAQQRTITIALPLAVFDVGQRPPLQDKLVMINSSGKVVWENHKTKIPPGETTILTPRSGVLPVSETPVGRVGAAIAFDMDFPDFMLQAGRQRTDLLIVPENEYPQVDPIHSRMALYRAVENGFNLLLHASQSLSLACDYQGRVYGLMDHYHATDRVLVAQLPTEGAQTIYPRGGYLFPWVCTAALVILLAVGCVRRPRT